MIIFMYYYRSQCKLTWHYICEYIVGLNMLVHNFIAGAEELKDRAR